MNPSKSAETPARPRGGPFGEVARTYPLATFFLLACIFSWGLWALMMASSRGLLPFPFPVNPSGSFGPALAALLVTWVRPGELRPLLSSLVRWRTGWGWALTCLLLPGVLWGTGLLVHLASGGALPAPASWGEAALLPVYFLVILVLGGPLGEEPGWRGLALPRLLERAGGLAASLVLAALWLVWHLPLFWLEGSSQAGASIPLFACAVASFSVLFTWVYAKTGGNLFAAVLFHAGVNTTSYALGALYPALDADPRFNAAYTATLGLAAALAVLTHRRIFLGGPLRVEGAGRGRRRS